MSRFEPSRRIHQYNVTLAVIVFFALVSTYSSQTAAREEWVAPQDADPAGVLREAPEDVRHRRFDTAFQKYSWYYAAALGNSIVVAEHDRQYALRAWCSLTPLLPDAREKLRSIRDRIAARTLEDHPDSESFFADLAIVNAEIDDVQHTTDLFRRLLQLDGKKAAHVYEHAEESLIATKQFEVCGQFLQPEKRFGDSMEWLQSRRHFAADRLKGDEQTEELEIAEDFFVFQATRIIGILAKNGRLEDAARYFSRANEVVTSLGSRATLRSALSGSFYSHAMIGKMRRLIDHAVDAPSVDRSE
jgi:hypothetical protein